MSDIALHLPINGVSFGQVSTALLREYYERGVQPFIFSHGKIDLSSQEPNEDFQKWISSSIKKSFEEYDRNIPIFRLWHLNQDSLSSYGRDQTLFSFYELDHPTTYEVNVAKNQKNLIFSSNHAKNIFESVGVQNCHYVPLGFDKNNFKVKDQQYLEGKIVFNLTGKLEKRKHHKEVIQAWVKKYGNNKDYVLQCAITNPFLKEQDFKNQLSQILEGKTYYNVNFLGQMQKNILYNDFLNSSNIVIGMSGGEGWGLPEFQSVALGKHGVILNSSGYQDWANEKNTVMVQPNGKEDSSDGVFFRKGGAFNQGNIFTFNEEEFIAGCEEAVERYKSSPINEEGLKLQDEYTYKKMVDSIDQILTEG